MKENHICKNCGQPLPASAPEGLCPRCLMAGALQPTEPIQRTMPEIDAVRAAFPQLEVLSLVGAGGMGAVFQARQPQLDRFVALKILAPERTEDARFAERFQREAQALARLNHPHIVTIHDFGKAGDFYYLLMEFVDGVNLRQAMKAGRFTPEQALGVVPPVCEALQFAHEHGIVHRDIKPENLLLDKAGRVKIADFGIAKMLGDGADVIGLAESQPAGTPQYMAPEQRDQKRTDHRADIYSLGVVLYEMLTGERPKDNIVPPSKRVQVDVRLDEIVLRALEKTPELRYQTAGEFRTQVETIVASASGASAAEPMLSRAGITSPIESRFSRAALVGAAWLTLCFVVVPPFLWHEGTTHEFEIHGPFASGLMVFVFFVFIFPAFIAPFGATLLGWIAITQIRRSAGKLYGLGLAVFDGLCFPLLALDALIVAVDLSGRAHEVPSHQEGVRMLVRNIPVSVVLLLLAVIIVVDFLVIRTVWRAVNRMPANASVGAPAAPRAAANSPLARAAMFFACLPGVLGVVTICLWPAPPQMLVWSILVSALLGIGLGMAARQFPLGRKAMALGALQTVVWLIIAAFGPRVAHVSPSSASMTFGPVIERVVVNMIDFDTGALVDFPMATQPGEVDEARYDFLNGQDVPDGKKPNKESYPWMRAHGVDAIEANHDLINLNLMLVARLTDEDWDTLTPAGETKLRALIPPGAATDSFNGPGIYGFKTREGHLGLVQVIGQRLPRGVRLRYKLVEKAEAPMKR